MTNTLEVTIRNELDEMKRLYHAVNDFMEARALHEDAVYRVNLALEEIISNIIKYGYDDQALHDIEVRIAVHQDYLVLTIEDDGQEFNPLALPEPDIEKPTEEREIGGLGIHLVRSMCDSMRYSRKKGKNVLDIRISSFPPRRINCG